MMMIDNHNDIATDDGDTCGNCICKSNNDDNVNDENDINDIVNDNVNYNLS